MNILYCAREDTIADRKIEVVLACDRSNKCSLFKGVMNDTIMDQPVAGYLVFTNHWFEGDPSVTKSFTFTVKDYKVDFNPEFRKHWLSAIRPTYITRRRSINSMWNKKERERSNITSWDTKSNYARRDHPFCQAIFSFFERMRGMPDYAPILILKEGQNPINGLNALRKIQSAYAIRHIWHLRCDPENLFDPRLTEKEREIRIRKAGIDLQTVNLMRAWKK